MKQKIFHKFLLSLDKVFNLNNLSILLLIISFFYLEVKGDLLERMLGNYLLWQNRGKAEIGRIWKKNELRATASDTIESLVLERKNIQKPSSLPKTMPEFLSLLKPERAEIISASSFIKLYNSLPFFLGERIFLKDELLELAATDNLRWVSFTKSKFNMEIVFYNAESQFMGKVKIDEDLFRQILRYHEEIDSPESFFNEFEDQIYEKEDFFSVIYLLDAEDRFEIIKDQSLWLDWVVNLKMAGLARTTYLDQVEIGFLIQDENGRYSIFRLSIPEMTMMNLAHALKEKEVIEPPRDVKEYD